MPPCVLTGECSMPRQTVVHRPARSSIIIGVVPRRSSSSRMRPAAAGPSGHEEFFRRFAPATVRWSCWSLTLLIVILYLSAVTSKDIHREPAAANGYAGGNLGGKIWLIARVPFNSTTCVWFGFRPRAPRELLLYAHSLRIARRRIGLSMRINLIALARAVTHSLHIKSAADDRPISPWQSRSGHALNLRRQEAARMGTPRLRQSTWVHQINI